MKDTERKAARLVTSGRVTVEVIEYDDDGDLRIAAGKVVGDSGETYDVSVTPGTAYCTCLFGENQPGHRHSHTIAMQLAAWWKTKKKEDK
jgi:hypothetical protein